MTAGRYEALVHALDAGVHFTAVACPKLVPLIEAGEQTVDAVREYAAPLQAGRLRHGHPRLHALPADPARVPARVRARRDARLLGRGDGARGRRHAARQGLGERARPRGRVPLPHHRRPGALPRARRALPPAAARRRAPGQRRRARARPRHDAAPTAAGPTSCGRSSPTRAFLEQPHGMVLWSQGKTRVLCTASIDGARPALAPPQRPRLGDGRVLAAARLDRRAHRARGRARQAGRAHGRDPAADRPRGARGVDFEALGERTVWLDCDVLQADGGTRCAAICGAYVAARRALDRFGLSKALTGLGRRGLGRRRRRRDAARPRLLGGLERRRRRSTSS